MEVRMEGRKEVSRAESSETLGEETVSTRASVLSIFILTTILTLIISSPSVFYW